LHKNVNHLLTASCVAEEQGLAAKAVADRAGDERPNHDADV
jgi:hypothetical protein